MGGIESFLLTLAGLEGRLLHEHAVCFEGEVAHRLREAGATVHLLGPVRLRRPLSVRRARRRLRAVLQTGGHQVVVAHGGWSLGIARPVARALGRRLVWFAHGPPVRTLLEWWALRRAPDLVLANSAYTAAAVAARLPRVSTRVIHPAVPPPTPSWAAQREATRQRLGVGPGEVVIAMVGRLDPCKGHEVLLQALSGLALDLAVRAWIVGGAQDERERAVERALLASAAGLGGRASFLGPRRDVPALLAAADIYCQPNVGPDAFGITFVEAMYAGLPVVTSDLGAAREVLGEAAGALLPAGDVVALRAALEALVRSPERRRALGAAGPARARALCDPAAQLARLEEALLDPVGTPGV